MSWTSDEYQSCYCEENIFKFICRKSTKSIGAFPSDAAGVGMDAAASLYAVFVSSPSKMTPIWCQRCMAHSPNEPVLWDYHVIALETPRRRRDVTESDDDAIRSSSDINSLIWDYDSTLPFPCSAVEYIDKAIRLDVCLRNEYCQYFRVVPSAVLMQYFASDRRHMRHATTGEFMKPPPPWPSICGTAATTPHNLDQYISEDRSLRSDQFGVIMNKEEFCKFVKNGAIL